MKMILNEIKKIYAAVTEQLTYKMLLDFKYYTDNFVLN